MADYTPTWATIATAFITVLESSNAIDNASNGYPDDPISANSLTYAVIGQPDLIPSGYTFGSVSVTYAGMLNVLVQVINTDAARLTATLTNSCALKALEILVDFNNRNNQRLIVSATDNVTHVSLGKSEIGRFSPWSMSNAHSYAGLSIPYEVKMQYRSN